MSSFRPAQPQQDPFLASSMETTSQNGYNLAYAAQGPSRRDENNNFHPDASSVVANIQTNTSQINGALSGGIFTQSSATTKNKPSKNTKGKTLKQKSNTSLLLPPAPAQWPQQKNSATAAEVPSHKIAQQVPAQNGAGPAQQQHMYAHALSPDRRSFYHNIHPDLLSQTYDQQRAEVQILKRGTDAHLWEAGRINRRIHDIEAIRAAYHDQVSAGIVERVGFEVQSQLDIDTFGEVMLPGVNRMTVEGEDWM